MCELCRLFGLKSVTFLIDILHTQLVLRPSLYHTKDRKYLQGSFVCCVRVTGGFSGLKTKGTDPLRKSSSYELCFAPSVCELNTSILLKYSFCNHQVRS